MHDFQYTFQVQQSFCLISTTQVDSFGVRSICSKKIQKTFFNVICSLFSHITHYTYPKLHFLGFQPTVLYINGFMTHKDNAQPHWLSFSPWEDLKTETVGFWFWFLNYVHSYFLYWNASVDTYLICSLFSMSEKIRQSIFSVILSWQNVIFFTQM